MRLKKLAYSKIITLIAVPILLIGSYLCVYVPGHERSFCAIRFGTGVRCPGCGIITAVSLLVHGEFSASFSAHPLGWAVVLWLILMWLKGLTGRDLGLKYFSYFLVAGLFITWFL